MAGQRALSTGIFESLFYLYLTIALLVGAAVLAWLFYSMWRFRAKPGDPVPLDAPRPGVIPVERGHVLWVYVMAGTIAAIMFGLAFSTISAVETLEHPPEDEPSHRIDVVGFQFGWRFLYTGEGGVPFSKIGEMRAPVGTNVVMDVTSQDVWHNFAIPDYRIRIDAVPGETTHLWFRAETTGEGHTVCVQLCGSGHAVMRATMIVLPQDEYDAWLRGESEKAYNALAGRGQAVNATLSGDRLVLDAEPPAGKPYALRIANPDLREVTVRSPAGEVLVGPQGAWLFVPAGATAEVAG